MRSFALTPSGVEAPAPQPVFVARRTALSFATATAMLLLTFSLVGGATDLFGGPTEPAAPLGSQAPEETGHQDAAGPTEATADGVMAKVTAPAAESEQAPPPSAAGGAQAPATSLIVPDGSEDHVSSALEAISGEGRERFPWLVLELAFGVVTGILGAATIWVYRRQMT